MAGRTQYISSLPSLKWAVLLQGFKRCISRYGISYFFVKRIFVLRLEERDLKSSALEERGIFQVFRVYGLFRSMALKTRHIKPYTKLAAFAYVKRRKSL